MYECSFTEGWTDKDLLLLENKLKSENFIFFKSFCEDFKKMEQQLFSKVEPETKVVLMKKESPSFYLIESKVFHFTYTYFYKLRNVFNAFKFSLQQRNFVPVVCVARAMFETTCCQLYFIEKINKQIRNLSKSNEITGESLGRAMYQIAKELNKSHTGTSFDWEKHLYNGFKPKTAKHLNINDPLRMVEKLTNKPINKYYALLSEMTHPNFGSNTLVIEKRGE